ncbi:FAD-dependent oxidoreductase [Clostridium sp. DL1XJH146]
MIEQENLICFDVIIAGGGVSGCTAAIAAARSGASVLVIEQAGYLGGALTSCGVGPMMTFYAGDKQIIKGVMGEVVENLIKKGYSPGHIKDTTEYISYVTPFNAEGLKLVLDEMLDEAGCKVLFHTAVCQVKAEDGEIKNLTICNKNGLSEVKGKVYIDATGDGDIANWSGATTIKGRELDGAMQPMTMNMKFCNVDTKKLREHINNNSEKFPRLVNNIDLMNKTSFLSIAGFIDEFKKAKEAGEISIPREDILFFETSQPGEFIINTTRVIGHDPTNPWSLSDAEKIGRIQCEELKRFLCKYVAGFENAHLEMTGPSIGIRQSRQVKGRYTLTAKDILERKEFDSVIAHSAYPIDIHNPNGEGTDSVFMSEPGTFYNIPFEIMISGEVDNLFITGRCVSATFEAQAAIRTTPTAGALGHACGVAAAIAAKQNISGKDVNVKKIQKILKEQNAFLEV